MNKFLKRVIQGVGVLFGIFPNGGVPSEPCNVCNSPDLERKLLEASNNLHLRCPACGRLIRPH
jgi:hypothetical protein